MDIGTKVDFFDKDGDELTGTIQYLGNDYARIKSDGGYDYKIDLDDVYPHDNSPKPPRLSKAEKTASERQNLWGMTFHKYGNGRSAIATPTEEFWADWKANRNEIKNLGFWVEKGVTYKVYARVNFQVDILDIGLEGDYPVSYRSEPKPDSNSETMRDDLESGLFNTNAASDLRAETPDEYDRRRDFEEDGYGDRY